MNIKDILNPADTKLSELIPKEQLDNNTIVAVAKNTYDAYDREKRLGTPRRLELSQENLIAAGYTWLKDVTMINYEADNDLDKLYDDIKGMICNEKVHHNGLPIVAVDLETTGLDRQWRRFGGIVRVPTAIIGIGVAFRTTDNEEIGVYIPTGHYKTNNHDLQKAIDFIQKIIDNYHTVYHNGLYDREILQFHGVKLNKNWSDTMLMAIHCGLRVSRSDSVGLKQLSDKLLGRTMLEITELDGDAKIYKADSESVKCYGCADVINTLALYWLFRDKYDDPYVENKFIANTDTKAADYANSLNRFNYPIHLANAEKIIRTTIRRIILCERKAQELTGGLVENVSSSDQIGRYIYNKILDNFKSELVESDTSASKLNEYVAKLNSILDKELKMEIKTSTLKSGEVKLRVNCGDAVLSNMDKLDKWDWMNDDTRTNLQELADVISTLRSCTQSLGVLSKIVRYAYVDDCPIPRMGTALKFFWAYTTRFSNEGGKGNDHIRFTEVKAGYNGKFIEGNGIAGVNAQGIPADPVHGAKAKRLIKIPNALKEKFDNMEKTTEAELKHYLTFGV